eukprot:9400190-Prorocentrum_lima.AAC.1
MVHNRKHSAGVTLPMALGLPRKFKLLDGGVASSSDACAPKGRQGAEGRLVNMADGYDASDHYSDSWVY